MEIKKIAMHWPASSCVRSIKHGIVLALFLCFPLLSNEVVLHLQEPTLANGVLSTGCGGILSAPGFRLQAQSISYTKKRVEGVPVCCVEAEGDLMLEYNEYVFLGKRLFYDFEQKCGILYMARGGREPWFFGAEEILFLSDGSYELSNGYFTTSESLDPEWKLIVEKGCLSRAKNLAAKKVRLRIGRATLFYFPKICLNLSQWLDSPIKYRFNFGGRQGARAGFSYEVFSWNHWKTLLRLDYRFNRGLGGGLETHYHNSDCSTEIHTINYAARDSAPSRPSEKIRFRFEGVVKHRSLGDKLKMDLSWDKISDRDMPSDYYDKGIKILTAEPTQLTFRWQERYWIGILAAVARFNNFQTLNQELPDMSTRFLPIVFGKSGIIMENRLRWSFLDFKYANQLPSVSDYSSTRFEMQPLLYRPFSLGPVVATPRIGGVFIHYGNGPKEHYRWVVLGSFGGELFTELSRRYGGVKHLVQPYGDYQYLTFPSTNPKNHYIFDIQDGWFRLNQLRFGVRNVLLGFCEGYGLRRFFCADLFTYAFFDTPTIKGVFPKVYGQLTYQGFSNFRLLSQSAWNFSVGQLDHVNVRGEWTANANFAISAEYRHRCAFDWRKADYSNFILDSFRSERSLRASQLSDRRDTLLLDFFLRFQETWALHVIARHGWNRMTEPAYNEYEIDLLTTWRSCWHVRFSYQHKEDEKRFAVYLSVKLERPDWCCGLGKRPCYE